MAISLECISISHPHGMIRTRTTSLQLSRLNRAKGARWTVRKIKRVPLCIRILRAHRDPKPRRFFASMIGVLFVDRFKCAARETLKTILIFCFFSKNNKRNRKCLSCYYDIELLPISREQFFLLKNYFSLYTHVHFLTKYHKLVRLFI